MNTFGNRIKISVFGESHGINIGVLIEGLPAGLEIDRKYINRIMSYRAPGMSPLATARKESDIPEFVSGVKDGITCGGAVCAIIGNSDAHSSDYSSLSGKPRPSHADYPAMKKYGGAVDLRGGGAYSGRLTAPICVAGAIALSQLEKRGIKIACHISSVGDISDTPFSPTEEESELMTALGYQSFPVISDKAGELMKSEILRAGEQLDSIGGTVECKITGLPAGLGEPMFDGVENVISRMIFGIPAIKGIEFGAGFSGTCMRGSEYNDSYYFDSFGKVRTRTNNIGGICGGMATGMPVIFRTAIKPTPSIGIEQDTVDMEKGENCRIAITGRHDPCIVPRAATVIRCACAVAIYDMVLGEEKIAIYKKF